MQLLDYLHMLDWDTYTQLPFCGTCLGLSTHTTLSNEKGLPLLETPINFLLSANWLSLQPMVALLDIECSNRGPVHWADRTRRHWNPLCPPAKRWKLSNKTLYVHFQPPPHTPPCCINLHFSLQQFSRVNVGDTKFYMSRKRKKTKHHKYSRSHFIWWNIASLLLCTLTIF